jgi:tyrosyl-tRNA synthetase
MVKMHYQMKRMWANMVLHAMKKHGYNRDPIWNRGFANNNTWLNKVTVVEFLKMLGQGVRVGEMLGRDT